MWSAVFCLILSSLVLSSCHKTSDHDGYHLYKRQTFRPVLDPGIERSRPPVGPAAPRPDDAHLHPEVVHPLQTSDHELDFAVHNSTKKTLYICCFSYIKKEDFTRWRWDKSDIHTLEPSQTTLIDIDTIPDEIDRENVFGYLAVFTDPHEAEQATYQLTQDNKKVDLDLLYKLKNKRVVIGVERYGIKGDILDFVVQQEGHPQPPVPELDFVVENQTGHGLYLTAFIYQHKGSSTLWRFDKTPVLYLEPGKQAVIDTDTINKNYERPYLRGYLGVFPGYEQEAANNSTFQLLASENKVKLGALFALTGKKIVLGIERYGVVGDLIDYTIKPIQHIRYDHDEVHPILTNETRNRVWR